MDNNAQKQFLASLSRPDITKLCLEMQTIITNLKIFLSDVHGYSESDLNKIMLGKDYTDIIQDSDKHRKSDNKSVEDFNTSKIREKFTQPNPQDFARLKKEDEEIRRSLTFELEWCINQVEQGHFPY